MPIPNEVRSWKSLAAVAAVATLLGAMSMWIFSVDTGPTLVDGVPPPRPPPTPFVESAPATPSKITAVKPEMAQPAAEEEEHPGVIEPNPDRVFDGGKLEDLATVAMARAHRTRRCYLDYLKEYGDIDPLPMLSLTVVDGIARVQLAEAYSGQESIEACLDQAFEDVKFAELQGDSKRLTWRLPEL